MKERGEWGELRLSALGYTTKIHTTLFLTWSGKAGCGQSKCSKSWLFQSKSSDSSMVLSETDFLWFRFAAKCRSDNNLKLALSVALIGYFRVKLLLPSTYNAIECEVTSKTCSRK